MLITPHRAFAHLRAELEIFEAARSVNGRRLRCKSACSCLKCQILSKLFEQIERVRTRLRFQKTKPSKSCTYVQYLFLATMRIDDSDRFLLRRDGGHVNSRTERFEVRAYRDWIHRAGRIW